MAGEENAEAAALENSSRQRLKLAVFQVVAGCRQMVAYAVIADRRNQRDGQSESDEKRNEENGRADQRRSKRFVLAPTPLERLKRANAAAKPRRNTTRLAATPTAKTQPRYPPANPSGIITSVQAPKPREVASGRSAAVEIPSRESFSRIVFPAA